MKTNIIYASAGEIRTYPYLLDSRHAVQMQLMVILLRDVYARGWRTVSGCTWDAQVRLKSPLNGWLSLRLSWIKHLARELMQRETRSVLAADVKTRKEKQGKSWGSIFASMDLCQTIPGGCTMVKPIVLERRS
jgi:hypothetical protein